MYLISDNDFRRLMAYLEGRNYIMCEAVLRESHHDPKVSTTDDFIRRLEDIKKTLDEVNETLRGL